MSAPRNSRRDVFNGRRLAVHDPAVDLHPTALKILQAAKRLLVAKGFEAITLEAIAAEAGVNKASTRYYFGNKAGLMCAIVDEIVLDGCAALASDVSERLPEAERLDSFIANSKRMATDVELCSSYFDILPHAVRDRHLRRRLVYLYDLWYDWNIEWLGLDDLPLEFDAELRALGQFTAAVADGIAVQIEIHGEEYDSAATLRLLREFLADVRSRMIASAGASAAARGR
jgi:AcrR family transcriptional regulator